MLEEVQAYVMKSKTMVVGKGEDGTSWKIGEMLEEVDEFKY